MSKSAMFLIFYFVRLYAWMLNIQLQNSLYTLLLMEDIYLTLRGVHLLIMRHVFNIKGAISSLLLFKKMYCKGTLDLFLQFNIYLCLSISFFPFSSYVESVKSHTSGLVAAVCPICTATCRSHYLSLFFPLLPPSLPVSLTQSSLQF